MAQNFNTGIHGKKNSPSRSGHDLSQKKAFTAKLGELLPVYWHFATPGSKWTITPQHFSRTQPLNTSAFIRIREHVDFYEVPFTLLWKSARQFLLGTGGVNPVQANSPQSPKVIGDYFPTIPLDYISKIILNTSNLAAEDDQKFLNEWGFFRGPGTYKLLTYLNYGDVLSFEDANELHNNTAGVLFDAWTPCYAVNKQVNILPLLAYQKVYADFFRNTQWEMTDVGTYNIDYYDGRTLFSSEVSTLSGKAADADGFFEAIYGVHPDGSSINQGATASETSPTMFDLRYALWDNDVFHSVLPNTQFGDVSEVDVLNVSNVPITLNGSIEGVSNGGAAPLFKLLGGATFLHPETAIDSLHSGFHHPSTLDPGIKENTIQVGATFPDGTISGGISGSQSAYLGIDAKELAKLLRVSGSASAASIRSVFDILQLRAASAVQRLREIQEFNHYDSRSQVDAIYGYELPREAANLAIYRGYTSNLDINDVTNTNLSGDGQATIAGKGTSSGRASFSFTATDFSVIIGVYYAVPMLDYDGSHMDMELSYTHRDDFPNPVLDSIGLEPVLVGDMFNYGGRVGEEDNRAVYRLLYDNVLGYTSRYYSIKTKLDVVQGAFRTSLRDWVMPYSTDTFIQYSFATLYGSDLLPEHTPDNAEMSALAFFHVNPRIADSVFAVEASPNMNTDCLLVNLYADVKAVLPYSRSGLPY